MRAVFSIVSVKDDFVLIKDECNKCNSMSVTNDAEAVVEFLWSRFNLSKRRLFYIDSNGVVDELLCRGFRFVGFKAGHEGVIL